MPPCGSGGPDIAPKAKPALRTDPAGRARALARPRRRSRWASRSCGCSGGPVPSSRRRWASARRRRRALCVVRDSHASGAWPPPIQPYEHAPPGDLLHLDTEKLGGIGGLGHRITGRIGNVNRPKGIGWNACTWRWTIIRASPMSRCWRTTVQPPSGHSFAMPCAGSVAAAIPEPRAPRLEWYRGAVPTSPGPDAVNRGADCRALRRASIRRNAVSASSQSASPPLVAWRRSRAPACGPIRCSRPADHADNSRSSLAARSRFTRPCSVTRRSGRLSMNRRRLGSDQRM